MGSARACDVVGLQGGGVEACAGVHRNEHGSSGAQQALLKTSELGNAF